jgi:hypothetical protein
LLFEIGTQKMTTGIDEYLRDVDHDKLEKTIENRRDPKVKTLKKNINTSRQAEID